MTISIKVPTLLCRVAVSPLLLYRWWHYGYSFRLIPLTQGKFAKVDQRDYEWLSKYKWCIQRENMTCYAIRNQKTKNGMKRVIMHRLIMNAPKGMVVDHINGDGLDNRRANLRICTIGQNSRNRRILPVGASRYKGVSWAKGRRPWRAIIYAENQQFNLGLYNSEVEAAKAYDAAALKYHKEFARLNFPQDSARTTNHVTRNTLQRFQALAKALKLRS